jgi:D-sedoheptulose 7-phosphate isomerase
MASKSIFRDNFTSHIRTIELSCEVLDEPVNAIGQLLAKSIANGGTIFWCGNGGSAADSQHLAAELVGRFKNNRRALRSLALTTDTSVLTCVANDYSYANIFSRQVEALARAGDVLIAISTSGRSENILAVLKTAKDMGLITIAMLGKDGGSAKDISDHALIVPSESTARIQETHILIGHILCELIEQELGLA